jgi:hypothetical protein
MGKKTEERYTAGDYLSSNPTWHEEDSPWKGRLIEKMLLQNRISPSSVCEVGCGAGGILEHLQHSLADNVVFSGYDISPQAHEIAKKKSNSKLTFHLKNILDENDEFFDVLLLIDVLEHIEDYFGFLRKIKNRSVYKIFHIPLDISVQRVLFGKPIMRRRKEVGHIHYFTKETALATLEDTGYQVIDHFYTAGSLDLPSTSFLYTLGKLPLRLAVFLNKDLAVRILGGHSLMVLAK